MRFMKSVGAGMKNVAKGIGKSLHVIEKGLSAADKASGGALRTMASTATGGLSEQALGAYNKNKGLIKKGLETTQRIGNITERVGRTGKIAGSGAYTFAKQQASGRVKDYMQQGERFLSENPKVSSGLSRYSGGQFNFSGMRK